MRDREKCEIFSKLFFLIHAQPPSLKSICRKNIWKAAGGPAKGLKATDAICRYIINEEKKYGPLPVHLKEYLLKPSQFSVPTGIFAEALLVLEVFVRLIQGFVLGPF